MNREQGEDFSVLDVAILVLEAVGVLHARGHERLRIFPGMSGSGVHWRTAVTLADNFTNDEGYTHLRNFDAAFIYTTGSEYAVGGQRVGPETTAEDLAQGILAGVPDEGKGNDPAYVAWYRELMELVRRHHAVPIAYADHFDYDRGWEVGWGSGVRVPGPPDPPELAVASVETPSSASGITNISHSVAFELMLENLFLSELLQEMWFVRGQVVDVLHSPVDAYGYDLVLQCNAVIRHVQLKTKGLGAKTAKYKLSTLLYHQPAACVVVLEWNLPPGGTRVELTYRWLGGGPQEPIPQLGEKIAKHTKGDAKGVKKEKPLHREVPLGAFTKVSSMTNLAELLFGPW